MRILLIGGTRFIGPFVVRQLLARGHEVTVLNRGQISSDFEPGVARISGDRRELEQMRPTLQKLAPEIVIDMIPYSPDDAWQVLNVFDGFARRILSISSIDVYRARDVLALVRPGPLEPVPMREDSPLRDVFYPYRNPEKPADDWCNRYDKIPMERVIQSRPESLPATVLRLPAVYGPGDYQHRVMEFLKPMDAGRPAILINNLRLNWRWTRGYVENVAAAIIQAALDDRAAGKIYNVGDDFALTEREWVETLARAAGWNGKIVPVSEENLPEHLKFPANWEQDWVCDTSRFRQELGFVDPVNLGEGLRRTVTWERSMKQPTADAEHYAAEDRVLAALK